MFKNPEHDFWIAAMEIIGILMAIFFIIMIFLSGVGSAFGTLWIGLTIMCLVTTVCYFGYARLNTKLTFAYEKPFYKIMNIVTLVLMALFLFISVMIPTPNPPLTQTAVQNSNNSIAEMNSNSSSSSSMDSAQSASLQKVNDQKDVLETARLYLDQFPTSKTGLYDQLIDAQQGGYSNDLANYAVDNLGVDWQQEAIKLAKFYHQKRRVPLKNLRALLTNADNKFTNEQAKAAVDQLK